MKLLSYILLAAASAAVVWSANDRSGDWSVREQETIQKTLSISSPPMRVVVDNVDGYVHVTAGRGPEVRLTAHKTIRAETDADLQEAKSTVKLETTEKPGSVSIYYDAPWRCGEDRQPCHGERRHFYNVTYDIDVEVPAEARIVVSTVNNGDIRIDKAAGDFEARNINGGIHMTSLSGSGSAHTINGPVAVHFAKNPRGACSFKSINGELDVYFKPQLSADLLFKTFNGEIYSDFEVTPRAATVTETEQHGGKFVYHSNDVRGGRAGSGGPELKFDTLNGNIRLHQEQ